MHENRDKQAPRAVVRPHHQHPVGRQPGEELNEQEGQRKSSCQAVASRERWSVPRAPHRAHEQPSSQNTVTQSQARDGEPCPTEFLAETYQQSRRNTGQKKPNWVGGCEDSREKLRGTQR